MTLRIEEKWVTLPSVKTNYTERSGAYEDKAQETRNRCEDGGEDPGLPGGNSVADSASFPGGGIQRQAVAGGVWSQLPFGSALGEGVPEPGSWRPGAQAPIRR
jgi:hypothetical protein